MPSQSTEIPSSLASVSLQFALSSSPRQSTTLRRSVGPASFLALLCALLIAVLPAWAAPGATTTTLAVTSSGAAVSSVASGSVVTLTATVVSGSTPVTGGSVTFCDATAAHCTDIHILAQAQLTKTGSATFNFRPGIGSHSYKAVFAGTPNGATAYAASTSSPVELTVSGLAPTTTTLSVTGNPGNYTLSSTVSGFGSDPTGSVSFLDISNGTPALGSAPLAASTVTFVNSSTPGGNGPLAGIAVADFNGDGIPDLALSALDWGDYHDPGTVSIYLGVGDGTFTAVPPGLSTNSQPNAIAVADFDGDGIPDLAVTVNYFTPMFIYLGNGDGTFNTITGPSLSFNPGQFVIGDFNGDGIPDLALVNSGGSNLEVLLGNGDGTFSAPIATPTIVSALGCTSGGGDLNISGGSFDVTEGDFNGDGILDLAVSDGSTVTILLGKEDGTFNALSGITPFGTTACGSGGGIAAADFNLDGALDLAVSNGGMVILLGKGDGTFTPAAAQPSVSEAQFVVGDFNGDGVPDIAVSSSPGGAPVWSTNCYCYMYPNGPVTILMGNGDGTFTSTSSPVTTQTPDQMAVGDFNGDGNADLVVDANNNNYTAGVWLAEPEATASVSNISPVGSGTLQVVASYPGDTTHQPSTSSASALTASMATPVVTVTPSASSINPAQALIVTISVSYGISNPAPNALTPTGSVTLTSGSYNSTTALANGVGSALAGGVASITVPAGSLAVGADTLNASYTGDSNFNPSSGTASVTVIAISAAASITLTFQGGPGGGLQPGENLNNYFNGGYATSNPLGDPVDTSGPGPNYGIVANSLQIGCVGCESEHYPGVPNGITTTAPAAYLDVAGGFINNLSYSYTQVNGLYTIPVGTINVYSGLDGQGALLASSSIDGTCLPTSPYNNLPDCYSASADLAFQGTAESIGFTGGDYITSITLTPAPAVTVPPSFTVTGTAVTVSAGSSTGNTSTITLTPATGFTGSIVMTAAIASGPSGAVVPPIFSFGSTSPVNITAGSETATLTIATTASQTGSCVAESRPTQRNPWYTGGVALACLVLFGLPGRRRKLRSTLGMVLLFALCGWGVTACGGTGKGVGCPTDIAAGTTPGTYTITVTGTAGSLVETGTVTLIVQ